MNELLSVVIPTYNSSKYITTCLNSILNQEYKNIEVIIVDDGSSDNTVEICNSYFNKDNRIKIFKLNHSGVSNSRNFALKKIKGDFLLFVDSDDELVEHSLDKIMEVFKDKKIDMCVFKIRKIFESGEEYTFPIYKNKIIDYNCFARSISINDDGLCGGGYMVNKVIRLSSLYSMNKNIPEFDNTLFVYEDKIWYLTVTSSFKNIYVLNLTGYIYYIRNGSLSRTINNERIINHYLAIKKIYRISKNNNYINHEIDHYCINKSMDLIFNLFYRRKYKYKDSNNIIKFNYLNFKNKIKYLICKFFKLI